MSFFLTALFFALVVGILRGLSLAADRPAEARVRAPASPLGSVAPASAVPDRRAA